MQQTAFATAVVQSASSRMGVKIRRTWQYPVRLSEVFVFKAISSAPPSFSEAAMESMPATVAEAETLQVTYTGTEHLLLPSSPPVAIQRAVRAGQRHDYPPLEDSISSRHQPGGRTVPWRMKEMFDRPDGLTIDGLRLEEDACRHPARCRGCIQRANEPSG